MLVFWGGDLGNLGGRSHWGVGEEQDLQKVPDQGVEGGRYGPTGLEQESRQHLVGWGTMGPTPGQYLHVTPNPGAEFH